MNFPRLEYRDTFLRDYNQIKVLQERIKLQESLAKVSRILKESNGDTTELTQTGLKYSPYEGVSDIDHFRINSSLRVSCQIIDGNLSLRYYGTHDRVQGAELSSKA